MEVPRNRTSGMNVQAVMQLQVCRNDEALDYLFDGLRSLVSRFSHVDPNACTRGCLSDPSYYSPITKEYVDVPTTGSCISRSGTSRDAQEDEDETRLLISVPLPEENREDEDDDLFILFNRALHLTPEAAEMVGKADFYDHLMAAIIFYNIGLAHHLKGLRTGESHLLLRAFDYYTISYKKILDQTMICLHGNAALLNLGFMALANNMGHIHAYFRSISGLRVCSDELCRRLKSITPSSAVGESVMSGGEYKVFFLNVCFIQEMELQAAPAA